MSEVSTARPVLAWSPPNIRLPELCDACDSMIDPGEAFAHWHDLGRSWNMHRDPCFGIFKEEVEARELEDFRCLCGTRHRGR